MNNKIIARFALVAIALAILLSGFGVLTSTANAAPEFEGYVYTESNASAGNSILVYGRRHNGQLVAQPSISTHGLGSGAGLGSQSALAMTEDGQWLLAVNAGSNEVSLISLSKGKTTSRVSSHGTTPVSVTVHDKLVYVVNSGGTPNIFGFWIKNGALQPIAHSSRNLGGTMPAQIEFTPGGGALVVTEKGTSTIETFTVDHNGKTNAPRSTASSGATPFGFAFGNNNTLVVSEAGPSAASSYHVNENGKVNLISGTVTNGQLAACWTIVTHNGKYAYTADAHNGMISSYKLGNKGNLTLLDGTAGTPGGTPLDEAVSSNDKFLYVLNVGTPTINIFAIQSDGNLSTVGTAAGVLASSGGLIVR